MALPPSTARAIFASREWECEELQVRVFPDRNALGRAAGIEVAFRLRSILAEQHAANIVFAAAPSQNEFLETLATEAGIDWARVNAFQLDEYVGLPAPAPQRFAAYLHRQLLARVHPGRAFYLDGTAHDPAAECARYAILLATHPVDILCAGIGENGHLAFNDPQVADFSDPQVVKVVDLEEACRRQQVHDGCFAQLDDVPRQAITLTIPALLRARWLYCVVPGPSKAYAVQQTLSGPIREAVPASVLRLHPRSVLYLDQESARLL